MCKYRTHDNLAVTEEGNAYESITAVDTAGNETEIDIKSGHKTEAYQEAMKIDIENIENIENNHKHYTKQWRKIYEVIQQEFFDETDFPDNFLKHCKNNVNGAHNIPIDVNNNQE